MGKRLPGTRGKRSPSPSVSRRRTATGPDITAQIADEICTALDRLGGDEELLAIVGSWRDTRDDADVLTMLCDYNAGRSTLHRAQ